MKKEDSWSTSASSYEVWMKVKEKQQSVEEQDMKISMVILWCIFMLFLVGCNCNAGSDFITNTICTTDKE